MEAEGQAWDIPTGTTAATYVKPCQLGVDACQTPRWHQADASADIFVAHIRRDRDTLGINR
jgi:hypothetical protein